MGNEFEILSKIRSGAISEQELVEIYDRKRDSYNILCHLVQHPRFPERFSLNIIADLFPMDLVRVIKNTRTRPYVRKRAELEFSARYRKFSLGEKLSYLKAAPLSLLNYFIEEKEQRVISTMLHNQYCREELIFKFINRKSERYEFYQALDTGEWYKRPQIAEAISMDEQAPVKMMIKIIPYLNLKKLKAIYKRAGTHQSVKKHILDYTRKKKSNF
ncbi:MAG: hypothetical protein KAT34_00750 [Candidatus Aminicenantes bacterium]|nr:hypothetical protein [Candidatus Aminicenantes bacterium]